MTELWTSALSLSTFSPRNPDGSLPEPADRREGIVRVAGSWQKRSARGDMVGFVSLASLRGSTAAERADAVNRVVELHGLMGSIGEQLVLAYAAEQDAQRWLALPVEEPEVPWVGRHHRMAVRGLCEACAHFLLAAAHALANTVLRVLLLDPEAAAVVNASGWGKRGKGFPPGEHENKDAWLTFAPGGKFWSVTLVAAAAHSTQLTALVQCLTDLQSDSRFKALEQSRGGYYHRHRPQSLSHTSPRTGIATIGDGVVTLDLGGADDHVVNTDAENDEGHHHRVVSDALVMLADAMDAMDPLIADAARSCHVTW
ncbi:hypothetical protein ACIQI7_38530 [Kitasatospora sp. NPDC092039]|uniref:hypothetical protein n=1 Tax=Kitasatospora sp. NPDC092039 TaxID=3364086 RepID=UPI003819CBA0